MGNLLLEPIKLYRLKAFFRPKTAQFLEELGKIDARRIETIKKLNKGWFI